MRLLFFQFLQTLLKQSQYINLPFKMHFYSSQHVCN